MGFSCWNDTWLANVLSSHTLCRQDSQAGQLSCPGGCWHVSNSGTVRDASVVALKSQWDFHTALMVLPAHIAAAPDPMAYYVQQISSRCETPLS